MKAIWGLAIGVGLVTASAAVAQFANPNGGAPPNGAANAAPAANANDPASDPLFAALDADGDGVITKKELGKALAILKKLDTDKDGAISWEEVKAARAAAGGAPANAANAGQVGQNVPGQGVNNPAGPNGGVGQNVPVGSVGGGGNDQVAGRLMQADTNHDGILSREELGPQMWNKLRAADQNRDGAIDPRELQMWVAQMGRQSNAMQQLYGQPNAGQGQMPGGGNMPQHRP